MHTNRRTARLHRTCPGTATALALTLLLFGGYACVGDQQEPDEPSAHAGSAGAAGSGGTSPSCDEGVAEATTARCSDECDNDGNARVDCDDANCCAFSLSCGPATLCGQQSDGNGWDGPLDFNDAQVQGIDPADLPSGIRPCRAPSLVRVDYVIDGDTLEVTEVDGGADERVRVIGVDTPEVAHGGVGTAECYGEEAAAFTTQLAGHLVWLTYDSECRDEYDRLLAYVVTGTGKNDWLERQLLRRGLARAYPYGGNRTFQHLFDADEKQAIASGLGLWGACAYY